MNPSTPVLSLSLLKEPSVGAQIHPVSLCILKSAVSSPAEFRAKSMDDSGESSLVPPKSANEKTVVVRVKRKACQSRLDAFWLEINERPLKRPLLDFENLSISDSSEKKEELKTKKVLVRHVETVSSSEDTFEIIQSIVPDSTIDLERKTKIEERRRTFKKESKQDKLLARARQEQEDLAKSTRFEQIWRSRKGNKEPAHDNALHDACRLYDILRVDGQETSNEAQEDTSLEDCLTMSSYLPLLREFIPSAAEKIESDIHAYMSGQATEEEYVYDFYTVKDDMDINVEEVSYPFPLVRVDDDDDFYDGPDHSDIESDDSNAEDNPRNDYPDEEEFEEDDDDDDDDDEEEEVESVTSDDESEVSESGNARDNTSHPEFSEDEDMLSEDETCHYEDDNDPC